MQIPFYICNGNGNSFIIVAHPYSQYKHLITKSNIQNICHNIEENIVDGFISINISQNKIIMDYYNNDGSWETFCLNGLRCVALVLNKKFNKISFQIHSNENLFNTKILNKQYVEIGLTEPFYHKKNIKINEVMGNYIDSGAKHFVSNYSKKWDDYQSLELEMKEIRYHDFFKPKGININYYKVIEKNIIEVKTYEKGVEKIMQSCGSGSYACAYDYSKKNNIKGKIKVLNDGGISQITFSKCYQNNLFRAIANIEYEGALEI